MRFLLYVGGALGAALLLSSCGDDTVVPTPVPPADLATAPVTPGTDLALAPSGDLAAAPTAMTVNVTVGPNGTISFAPATVMVHPGDTVTWTWAGGPHTVTSGTPGAPDGRFCSLETGTPPSAAACAGTNYARFPPFSFSESNTFRTPGTYPYYCTVHGAAMTGTVISR